MVNYAVQYDQYKELCENKNKPELECNGTCKLSKEIASVGSASSEPVLNNLAQFFVPLFFDYAEVTLQPECKKIKLIIGNSPIPLCYTLKDIDYPPELV